MTHILIVSDSSEVSNQVKSVLPPREFDVSVVDEGATVRQAVLAHTPDLVVLDLQVGRMGGMAICLDLRLEASGGRLPEIPTLLLLDRRADVFLARRAQADGWLIKPLEPLRVRKAVKTILAGDVFEDASYKPNPVAV